MNDIVSPLLLETLSIALTFSVFQMAIMQKIKGLPFCKDDRTIWLTNLALSFLLGIPFCITFYYKELTQSTLILSLWVSFLGFVGAPGIYEGLKNQSFINYSPKSRNEIQSNGSETLVKGKNRVKPVDEDQ